MHIVGKKLIFVGKKNASSSPCAATGGPWLGVSPMYVTVPQFYGQTVLGLTSRAE